MTHLLLMLGVFFAFSFAVGYVLISPGCRPCCTRRSCSMTNAISAVTILGALLLFAAEGARADLVFGRPSAVIMAAFNLVGGFVITAPQCWRFSKHTQGGLEE